MPAGRSPCSTAQKQPRIYHDVWRYGYSFFCTELYGGATRFELPLAVEPLSFGGNVMKKLLAATLLAASFATPAFSADMAVKAPPMVVSPAYDWSGFYFGAAVGGAWGKFDDNLTNGPAFAIPNVSTRYLFNFFLYIFCHFILP